ncbi:hypothetical protein CI610_01554 [invertebrate metagenome]|uniref:ISXO2-like transposase domain-containing protein n=1 Tax=invertebrate metagenome TaxID=1711999 RepID=A0A2H9T8D4_9ZZZZ
MTRQKKLEGIIEVDETFFWESFKGQRDGLPRAPGRRVREKVKARRSPVMVARDRQVNTVDRGLKNEGGRGMVDDLKGRISIEALVYADASLAHESLTRKLGFPFKELTTSAGQYVREEVFHILHINATQPFKTMDSRCFSWSGDKIPLSLSWLASYVIRALRTNDRKNDCYFSKVLGASTV